MNIKETLDSITHLNLNYSKLISQNDDIFDEKEFK